VQVTAIVPTYNRAEYLGACLESLLAQTTPPQQLIVVDDGSTDGTPEVIRSFGDALEPLRQDNAGKAAALNLALSEARGDAVWIFDDDDVAVPEALELLAAGLRGGTEAGFAFGAHDSFSAPDAPVAPRAPAVAASLDLDDLFHGILTRRAYVFQAAMLVRRRCYEEVGPFDTTFPRAQDFDMLTRLAARYEATQVDAVVFHQRQHTGDRGPAHLRIDGRHVWDHQYDFDVQVAQKVHRTLPPEVFLPRRHRDAAGTTAAARLRRAAAMAEWGLWDEATEDLRALEGLPPPAPSMASTIGADFRLGAERMRVADGDGTAVLDEALSLTRGPVRDEVVAVLLWPPLRGATKSALRGRLRSGEASALWSRRGRVGLGALARVARVGAGRLLSGARRRVGRHASERPA
jgi:Glycosyl transferase family 2